MHQNPYKLLILVLVATLAKSNTSRAAFSFAIEGETVKKNSMLHTKAKQVIYYFESSIITRSVDASGDMNTAIPDFIAGWVALDQCSAMMLKAQPVLPREQSSMDIVHTETAPTARTRQMMICEACTNSVKRGEFHHIHVARSKRNENYAMNFKVAERKRAAQIV